MCPNNARPVDGVWGEVQGEDGMSRALVSILAFALLLGMGTLAVLARPGADENIPAAESVVVSQTEVKAAEPLAAPLATNRSNNIGLPLDTSSQFTDAKGLAAYIGSSVQQVGRWYPSANTMQVYYPSLGFGTNFTLTAGSNYWLSLDSSAPVTLTFVGAVPDQGTLHFSLLGNSSKCIRNDITLPLDHTEITNALTLAQAIVGGNLSLIDQVARWDPSARTFQVYYPNLSFGTNFVTHIGYPYSVCLRQNMTWP